MTHTCIRVWFRPPIWVTPALGLGSDHRSDSHLHHTVRNCFEIKVWTWTGLKSKFSTLTYLRSEFELDVESFSPSNIDTLILPHHQTCQSLLLHNTSQPRMLQIGLARYSFLHLAKCTPNPLHLQQDPLSTVQPHHSTQQHTWVIIYIASRFTLWAYSLTHTNGLRYQKSLEAGCI